MSSIFKYFLFLTLFVIGFWTNGQTISVSGFTASQYHKFVLLNWTIDSGSICNGITIYRSLDSLEFEEIGSIAGICGSNTDPTPYHFTDQSPTQNRINYYRLKMGNAQWSEIISLYYSFVKPNDMVVHPNPTRSTVTLDLNKDQNSVFEVNVISNEGKIMIANTKIAGTTFSLDVSSLSSGNYLIELIDENDKKIQKKLIIY
jgi:hypothetical protein